MKRIILISSLIFSLTATALGSNIIDPADAGDLLIDIPNIMDELTPSQLEQVFGLPTTDEEEQIFLENNFQNLVVPAAACRVDAKVNRGSDNLFRMSIYVNGSKQYTWLTSPGKSGSKTPLFQGKSAYNRTKLHIVSSRKSYAGAKMPYAVWIKGGYASHGTNAISQLGRRASHGCLRLRTENAKILYDLAGKCGLSNVRYYINNN